MSFLIQLIFWSASLFFTFLLSTYFLFTWGIIELTRQVISFLIIKVLISTALFSFLLFLYVQLNRKILGKAIVGLRPLIHLTVLHSFFSLILFSSGGIHFLILIFLSYVFYFAFIYICCVYLPVTFNSLPTPMVQFLKILWTKTVNGIYSNFSRICFLGAIFLWSFSLPNLLGWPTPQDPSTIEVFVNYAAFVFVCAGVIFEIHKTLRQISI